MSRKVNYGVLEHLFEVCPADMEVTSISIQLIRAAGDAIADMMLDVGYQVETSYMDGRDVVQTYFNPRTGGIVEDLAFTLALTETPNRGANLHVLLKVPGPQVKSCESLGSAVRESRGWYQALNSCATVWDVLSAINPGITSPRKTEQAFQWRVAA
jgi:hypothetical protein